MEESNTAYIRVGIRMQSYIPENITEGMIFIRRNTEELELWRLPYEVTKEEEEEFLKTNGAPVRILLYHPTYQFSLPIEEVGWVDVGDDGDEELTLDEFDIDGFIELYNEGNIPELLVGVKPLNEMMEIVPVLEDGKAIIAFFEEDEEEDE